MRDSWMNEFSLPFFCIAIQGCGGTVFHSWIHSNLRPNCLLSWHPHEEVEIGEFWEKQQKYVKVLCFQIGGWDDGPGENINLENTGMRTYKNSRLFHCIFAVEMRRKEWKCCNKLRNFENTDLLSEQGTHEGRWVGIMESVIWNESESIRVRLRVTTKENAELRKEKASNKSMSLSHSETCRQDHSKGGMRFELLPLPPPIPRFLEVFSFFPSWPAR